MASDSAFALHSDAERETWLEIDEGAFLHNIATVNRWVKSSARLMAVMKANAYGHGVSLLARSAVSAGAYCFGVATAYEGGILRASGIELPIVILSPTSPRQAELIVKNRLTPAITTLEMAQALAGTGTKIHLKVNTGMNRSGVELEAVPELLVKLNAIEGVEVEGIFSHLAGADLVDRTGAYAQFERFLVLLKDLSNRGIRPPIAHIANSSAILDMPEMALDMIRPGIALYGLYASDHVTRLAGLRPVLSWKARVVETRRLKTGDPVSYAGAWIAPRETTVALLPVGYGDGYRRRLSNNSEVLIRGRRCPVVGRVCMDLFLVDCGDLDVASGDEAVLIGTQGDDAITADELAARLDTINYEIITQISERVPRKVVERYCLAPD